MSEHTSIVRIKAVKHALQELNDEVVYVGGATVSLYADRAVNDIRPTDDIDVIVEVVNYNQRQQLEDRLRDKGFANDVESGIICRYKVKGIIVDIMPTDDPSIGFHNKWYPAGFENSVSCALDESVTIKILTAPYFLATKLEAFKSRGGGDGRISHDFEDIVFVLENRKALWEELDTCDTPLKTYLITEFEELLANPRIDEWIESNVERGNYPSATAYIIAKIKEWLETNR